MADRRSQLALSRSDQDITPKSHKVVKGLTAATLGGGSLVASGLTLTGTIIAITIATPLLVIFSPILVPAAGALLLATAGFVTSGGFAVAAIIAFSWMYGYVMGKHPPGAKTLDQAKAMVASKAQDLKEQYASHTQSQ
ncbi:hypothetical protein AMTRI_Chr13g83000 [Amborella trichopoda]|uniref:Oleosin n=1 Tax=Amborella trichopoda TaxID=13333 RepID=W1NY11_AMBTC|nr:oleosin 16 kDa [Amborella trichopoda]ERN00229.1 hypothetical protein AMTR_s00111p00122760 [Amborella trichopoda]|eukprot:XP_006837375.1 oleosin 16 kDa [Amborella trichopoda]